MSNAWDQTERRQSPDRRTAGRGGKFDRRRNRCGRCRFFEPPVQEGYGFCTRHQKPFHPDDFACSVFHEKEK